MPKKTEDDKKQRKRNTTKKVTKTRMKDDNEIEISKQLLAKRKSIHKSSRTRSGDCELKISAKQKPLPPLADLEKLFESSDSEDTNQIENGFKTPKLSPDNIDKKNTSPNSIQKIAEHLNKFSRMSDLSELSNDPPGTSQKEGKVTVNLNEEEIPKNQAKKAKLPNQCTSILNKSDKIVDMTGDFAGNLSDSSNTSSDTVPYDYLERNVYRINRQPSFSPIPSTSKDNETMLINDKLFNDSCVFNNNLDSSISETCNNEEPADTDVQIIDESIEPIVIDDKLSEKIFASPVLEVLEEDCDDSVQIIEPVKKMPRNEIPVDGDAEWLRDSCLNFNNMLCNDIIEVIDVDEVIAENKSILEKYKKCNLSDTIITIDTSLNQSKNNTEPIVNEMPNRGPVTSSENRLGTNGNIPHDAGEGSANPYRSEIETSNNRSNLPQYSNYPPIYVHNSDEDIIVDVDDFVSTNSLNIDYITKKESVLRIGRRKRRISLETSVSTPIKSPQANGGIGDCPICMDNFKGKHLVSTLCGHVFCLECIKKSIKSIGKKCPKCRQKFKGVGYIKLFL